MEGGKIHENHLRKHMACLFNGFWLMCWTKKTSDKNQLKRSVVYAKDQVTTYIPIDDETHLKTLYPVYKCSVSGCSAFDIRDGYESTPSHTMTSYSYTGSNYHAGNYHYIRYERHCVQCGHSTGYWDHYSCPGNGHCILPQSVFPVLSDSWAAAWVNISPMPLLALLECS